MNRWRFCTLLVFMMALPLAALPARGALLQGNVRDHAPLAAVAPDAAPSDDTARAPPLDALDGAADLQKPDQSLSQPQPVTDEAQRLYQKYGDAVYQVQVVDKASGKKSAIGSGFQFTTGGYLATNYHVVSDVIRHPDSNRLEFLHENGERGALKILTADVVHDIAILQMEKPGTTHVTLGTAHQPKGSELFALGNPYDIGFTIVEGINNGFSSDSFLEEIHFSGAINQGMSGGPALGHDGRVVGINVKTGGNGIGFLVPVDALVALAQTYAAEPAGFDFLAHADQIMADQLEKKQQQSIDQILAAPAWDTMDFGPIRAPGAIHPAIKCWGGVGSGEKDPYMLNTASCETQDTIFLGEDAGGETETASFRYHYELLKPKKQMGATRFYSLYTQLFGNAAHPSNAGEEDVTNFECNDGFTDTGHALTAAGAQRLRWKTSFCVRQYIRYPRLYDAHLYMALVGNPEQGVIVGASVLGVTQDNALRFMKRFVSSISAKDASIQDMPVKNSGTAGAQAPTRRSLPKGEGFSPKGEGLAPTGEVAP